MRLGRRTVGACFAVLLLSTMIGKMVQISAKIAFLPPCGAAVNVFVKVSTAEETLLTIFSVEFVLELPQGVAATTCLD